MAVKNRNLFRITRFILLKLPLLLRFLSRFRKAGRRILIIKTDAIGDYILFRNFIEIVKTDDGYKDYEIDLVAAPLLADLTLTYDSKFVSEFYFAKPEDLYESPLKVIKLARQLYKRNYALVLQPTYSRTFINDAIAALTGSNNLIGFESDNERIEKKYKAKTDKFYNQKLNLPNNIYFEFDRNKFFFETVLNKKIAINGPHFKTGHKTRQGIIIFPGAGVKKRGWEIDKFQQLIKLLIAHSNQRIYIAGGPAEIEMADYLTIDMGDRVGNLAGKTSLSQLVELIGSATLVISNETSATHIAAATDTPAICILGGGHFGRFAPYPQQIIQKAECAYEKMECYNCNWNCIYKTTPDEPYPCISAVSLDKVWLMAQQAINQL